MKIFTFFILFIVCLSGYAQHWEWARKANATTAGQIPRKVCGDNLGNVFLLGNNEKKATYGNTVLDSGSFIVKYDSIGNIQWAKNIEGTPKGIDCDAFGNLYVVGNFMGNISVGSYYITSNGDYDFYLIKMNPSGNELWVKSYGGVLTDWSNAVQIDKKGNAYLTGHFWGDSINFGSYTLKDTTPAGHFYLVKINSIGTVQWASEGLSNDSTGDYWTGMLIRTDKKENIYVIARGSTCNSQNCSGELLARFDSLGNLTFSNFKWSSYEDVEGLAIDDSLNIFALYFFTNQYGGYGTLSKYNASMNQSWSHYLGNGYEGYSFGAGLSIDSAGNIFTAGNIGNDWNSSSDSILFDSNWIPLKGQTDVAVIKINSSGSLMWIKTAGGNKAEFAYDMCVNQFGDCFVAGLFNWHYSGIQNDTVIVGIDTLINDGNWGQSFVAKLEQSNINTSVQTLINNDNIFIIYPNPTSGIFTVNLHNCQAGAKVIVRDVLGNCFLERNCRSESSQEINLSCQPRGIYFVELLSGDERVVRKVTVQ